MSGKGVKIDVLDKGFVRLVDYMGDDAAITQAARVSYNKHNKKSSNDETLIRYLMRNKHTSPFEMVEFKFHCKMPIFVARQWIRHRTASVNEISARYTKLPNERYVPKDEHFTKQSPTNKQGGTNEIITLKNCSNPGDFVDDNYDLKCYEPWSWGKLMAEEQEQMHQGYERLLKTGVRKELARNNLPLSQYTEWFWKIDLHNLFHFLNLRLSEHAQFEFQQYAKAIFKLIEPIVPISVAAFREYVLNAVVFHADDLLCAYQLFDVIKNSVTNSPTGFWSVEEIEKQIEYICNDNFSNKREAEEAKKKLRLIFIYDAKKNFFKK